MAFWGLLGGRCFSGRRFKEIFKALTFEKAVKSLQEQRKNKYEHMIAKKKAEKREMGVQKLHFLCS